MWTKSRSIHTYHGPSVPSRDFPFIGKENQNGHHLRQAFLLMESHFRQVGKVWIYPRVVTWYIGASQRDHAIWPHYEGMCYSTYYSWVAKHLGRASSTACLPSCLTFSSTLFPPFSLFGFVREMRIYKAMILDMRVREDIHRHRYMHALCVVSGIILSVSTLCSVYLTKCDHSVSHP